MKWLGIVVYFFLIISYIYCHGNHQHTGKTAQHVNKMHHSKMAQDIE